MNELRVSGLSGSSTFTKRAVSLFLCQRWLKRIQQGKSLLEVLIAILITVTSVTLAPQAFMKFAFLGFRAQQFGDVQNWVQKESERVREKADAWEKDELLYLTLADSYATSSAPDRLVSFDYAPTPAEGSKAAFEHDEEVTIYTAFRFPAYS